jgi:hypothetical protein
MEIQNLYKSYPEIFDLKDIPSELLNNSEIIPFYFETEEKPVVGGVNIGRPIEVFPPSINRPSKPIPKNEVEDGDIPMLILNGKLLGLYLPFHFYYRPEKPKEKQIWGVWIVESVFSWFSEYLKDIECDEKTKSILTKIYIVNFALFYHKVEIFVTSNEIFERDLLYKHHFTILKKDLLKLIDRHAHAFACNKILSRISATKDVPYKTLEKMSKKFSELFENGNSEELKQEHLLNDLYNRMHQPSKRKSEQIWVDLKHWFDSHINIDSQDNLFLVREIKPL